MFTGHFEQTNNFTEDFDMSVRIKEAPYTLSAEMVSLSRFQLVGQSFLVFPTSYDIRLQMVYLAVIL